MPIAALALAYDRLPFDPDGGAAPPKALTSQLLLPGMAGGIAIAPFAPAGPCSIHEHRLDAGRQRQPSRFAGSRFLVDVGLEHRCRARSESAGPTLRNPHPRWNVSRSERLIPFGYANLRAEAAGPWRRGGQRQRRQLRSLRHRICVRCSSTGASASSRSELAEAIIAPAGSFDMDQRVDLGVTTGDLDAVGAGPGSARDGSEVSVAPGVISTRRMTTPTTRPAPTFTSISRPTSS